MRTVYWFVFVQYLFIQFVYFWTSIVYKVYETVLFILPNCVPKYRVVDLINIYLFCIYLLLLFYVKTYHDE